MAHNSDQSLTQLQRQGKITKRQLETQLIKRYGSVKGSAKLKKLLRPQ